MNRQLWYFTCAVVVVWSTTAGCRAPGRFYPVSSGAVYNDYGYYERVAREVPYSDVTATTSVQAQQTAAPITLTDPEKLPHWDITLPEVLAIAVKNSEVIRTAASVTSPAPQSLRGDQLSSVYDPEIVVNDPQAGIHAALAEFDFNASTDLFWNKTDRPQNFGFFQQFVQQTTADFNLQVDKKTLYGTQLFFRNVTNYDHSNNPFQSVASTYSTAMEIEARQPLLRGAGKQVNRAPILLAHINSEITAVDLEANVRNLILDIEQAYWDLFCAYKTVETAKIGLNRSRTTWQIVRRQAVAGKERAENELLTREQFLGFQLALKSAIQDLHNKENRLRFFMGITATDGRLLSPTDVPNEATVQFDWNSINHESLVRTPELRRQRSLIQRGEMELLLAKNSLLPDLNVVGLYRWLGIGDELIASSGSGVRFPSPGSRAFEELAVGDFQETRFGVELVMPQYRRELAGVRNAQLTLTRERAILSQLELNVSHLLTDALRTLDSNYQFAVIYKARMEAAESELEKRRLGQDLPGGMTLSRLQALLDALRRSAESQRDYYVSLCEYNKAIALVHYRKGSLLEYDDVHFADFFAPLRGCGQGGSCHPSELDYSLSPVPTAAQNYETLPADAATPSGNGEAGMQDFDPIQRLPHIEQAGSGPNL